MKPLRSALVISGITVALLAIAVPAQAAAPALPDGDKLVAASCDDTYPDATLFSVDSATGQSTAAGPGNVGYNCAYQAAWDATSSTLYGTIWDDDSVLVRWDTATGALVEVGPIVDSSNVAIDAYSLVIGLDGRAFINEYNELYQVDLTTGVATDLGQLAGVTDSAYGFSVDPSTGLLYLLQENGDLLLVDPDAVTATYVASWTFSTNGDYTYGLAIDRAGTAWVVEFPGADVYSALYSTPLATFGVAPESSGDIVDAANSLDFSGWWVALTYPAPAVVSPAAPALADTGVDVAPIALTGVLLGAVGFVLLTRRRKTA